MEKIKTNPVSMKVHPEFRDILVEGLVKKRIDNDLEPRKKPATYCQITKMFYNFFDKNPKILKVFENKIINGK